MQAVLLAGLALLLAGPFTLSEPFGLGFQLTWSLISVAAAALILMADAVKGGTPRTRLDWWLLAYVAAVALTSIGSVDRWSTLKASVTVAAEIGLFYAAASVARRMPRAIDAVLLVIIVAISLVELIALGYHAEVGLAVRPKEYPILPGWAGYPELGALGVLAFGLLLGLLLCARDRWTGWSAAGALLLLSAEIVLLYSRTAWLASAVVASLALLVVRWPVKWKVLVVAVAVAAGAAATLASPTIRFLVANLVTGTVEAPAGIRIDIASPSTRINLWQKTITMIADAPLNGVGLGNFRGVFETEYNPELNDDQRRGVHAHNLWLQKAAELGIPGGICYLAVWGVGLWVAYRSARLDPKFRTTGVFLALAGTAVSEFTDNVPYMVAGLRVYLLTWVLLGLAVGGAGEGAGSAGNTLRGPGKRPDDDVI